MYRTKRTVSRVAGVALALTGAAAVHGCRPGQRERPGGRRLVHRSTTGTWTVSVTFSAIEVREDRPVAGDPRIRLGHADRARPQRHGDAAARPSVGARARPSLTWSVVRLDYQNMGKLNLDRPAECEDRRRPRRRLPARPRRPRRRPPGGAHHGPGRPSSAPRRRRRRACRTSRRPCPRPAGRRCRWSPWAPAPSSVGSAWWPPPAAAPSRRRQQRRQPSGERPVPPGTDRPEGIQVAGSSGRTSGGRSGPLAVVVESVPWRHMAVTPGPGPSADSPSTPVADEPRADPATDGDPTADGVSAADGASVETPWEADVVLSDGGTVHVRPDPPVRRRARSADFHTGLSQPESVYYRFFSPEAPAERGRGRALHHRRHGRPGRARGHARRRRSSPTPATTAGPARTRPRWRSRWPTSTRAGVCDAAAGAPGRHRPH